LVKNLTMIRSDINIYLNLNNLEGIQ